MALLLSLVATTLIAGSAGATPTHEVRVFWRGELDESGSASVRIRARCTPPWSVANLSVQLTQGADTGLGNTQDFSLACTGRWIHRVIKVIPSPGAFDPGNSRATASFSIYDPTNGDPVGTPAHLTRRVWLVGMVLPVLWDQTGSSSGSRASADYADNDFDSQAADDFTVPAGQSWSVTSVFAHGGNASSHPAPFIVPGANVLIYQDGGTEPGALITSYISVPPTTSPDDLTIPLSPTLVLGAGTYWISVQANFNTLGISDAWGWAVRQNTTGDVGVWRAGPALGSGNENWTPLQDFEFDLRGSSASA
jgi:hypothetical protein